MRADNAQDVATPTLSQGPEYGLPSERSDPSSQIERSEDETELVPLSELPLRHVTSALAPEKLPLKTSMFLQSNTSVRSSNSFQSTFMCSWYHQSK